jgi:hypothetical protein
VKIQIQSWPQAAVVIAGIIAISALGTALIMAGWSSEAIVGFVIAIAGIVTGQYVQARKTSEVVAKTDQQTEMLETVVAQTNGLSEAERRAIAEMAAESMLRKLRPGPDPFASGRLH